MPSKFTLEDFEEAPESKFSLADFQEEPTLRPEIGELRQAVTAPDLGPVPFEIGGVNAPPTFQASTQPTIAPVIAPPEPFVPAIPRQPVSGKLSTTFGGPRKPLASYAETMESLQEVGRPIEAFIAPRPSPTEPRIDIPDVPIPKEAGFWNAAAREAVNAAASVPEFFSSDAGILAAMSAKLAPRLTSAGFSIDLFHSAFQQAKNLYKNWGKMTPAERGKASVDTLASLVLGGTTGAHAAGLKLPARTKPVEKWKPAVETPAAETPVVVETKAPSAETPKPKILTPAVRSDEGPEIETAANHGAARLKHAKAGRIAVDLKNEGFVDENNVFHSRTEALPIFKELSGGKTPANPERLTSEDLRDAGLLKHLEEPKPPGPAPAAKEPTAVIDARKTIADYESKIAQDKADAALMQKASKRQKLTQEEESRLEEIESRGDEEIDTERQALELEGYNKAKGIVAEYEGKPPKPTGKQPWEMTLEQRESEGWIEVWRQDRSDVPTTGFNKGAHWGTKEQAEVIRQREIDAGRTPGRLRHAFIKVENPLETFDGGFWEKPIREAQSKGHDTVVYNNEGEGVGGKSYIPLSESQVREIPDLTKPTPPTPRTPTAKEPWEMTAREFWSNEIEKLSKTTTEGRLQYDISGWTRPQRIEAESIPDAFVFSPEGTDKTIVELRDASDRTRTMANDALLEIITEGGRTHPSEWRHVAHEEAVKQARAEGKTIPPEVLADYPDLAKPTPAPAAEKKGEVPDLVSGLAARRPTDKAGGIRWDIRNGRVAGLKIKLLYRPVSSNEAVISINGQRFVIDNSARLKSLQNAGAEIDYTTKKTIPSSVKTTGDWNTYVSKYPKLGAEDFGATGVEKIEGQGVSQLKPTPPPGTQGLAKTVRQKWTGATDPNAPSPTIRDLYGTRTQAAKDIQRDILNGFSFVEDLSPEAGLAEMSKSKTIWTNEIERLKRVSSEKEAPNERDMQDLRYWEGKSGKQMSVSEWVNSYGMPTAKESLAKAQLTEGAIKRLIQLNNRRLKSEGGFVSLAPIQALIDRTSPYVKAVVDTIMAVGKHQFDIGKATDFRRSVFHWSAKLQRSFGEAASAQKEIRTKVPDKTRREGITNWIQAGGDPTILASRRADTEAWRDPVTGKPHPQQKQLLAGYDAALNLTPDEIAVAQDAKRTYDALGARGQTYDVLKTFKENYVTQIWNLRRGPIPKGAGVGRSLMLKDRFRFAKASKFDTYFDGEQAGYIPKTKDIADILPMYMHEMNSVIAARQLVEQMAAGKASNGEPLLASLGKGIPVDGPQGKATLVLPDIPDAEAKGYERMDRQPALHGWIWAAKDTAGNPIFSKTDLVVHPEVADHFRNVLGRSAIKEWYRSRTTASAEIPKFLARALDLAQSETKRTMLGVLTPFHQVQEATHAIGHRVNPFFNNPKIDLVNDVGQMDAAQHGLMLLPDRTSAQQFMEGFKQSAIVTKIPVLGPLADHYSEYLFHQYIPGIKYKTYQAILQRNTHLYGKELTAGKATLEDIKILSAEQANAAYGHLNYADLGRNPTILHIMRLGLLAPDFLEARARFAGQAIKGVTGQKIGREQLVALATLALAQASLSYIMANITGGVWDEKDPFAFHVGNKKFTMRSVPEDSYRFAKDTRSFVYARLNPIIGRGAVQYASGVDWRGQKVTKTRTTKELLTQPVPLFLRPLVGLGNTPLEAWEEIAAASGLKISRYSAVAEMYKVAHQWKADHPDQKVRRAEERYEASSFPDSDYKPLRESLIKNDMKGAMTAYEELLKTGHPHKDIDNVMKPWTGGNLNKATNELSPRHPKAFTTKDLESQFVASLTDEQKLTYNRAVMERQELYDRFTQMVSKQQPTAKPTSKFSLKDFE